MCVRLPQPGRKSRFSNDRGRSCTLAANLPVVGVHRILLYGKPLAEEVDGCANPGLITFSQAELFSQDEEWPRAAVIDDPGLAVSEDRAVRLLPGGR